MTSEIADLTEDEHNALQYVAGFVPYSLLKKLSKHTKPKKEQLGCLSVMAVKGKVMKLVSRILQRNGCKLSIEVDCTLSR